MSQRPTIKDLAAAAGVGLATVDRVIHGRAHVSDGMRARIAEAAERIGYRGAASIARPAGGSVPSVRLGFVLHKGTQQFYQEFARRIEAAAAARRDVAVDVRIRFSPSQSPDDFLHEISDLAGSVRAVAASAVNHPSLGRLAEDLRSQGVAVFSLLNDFAGRAGTGYLGLDNMKAGRLAGWMMATRLQRKSRVAVFVGGSRWHGHAMRETGFRSYLREHAPEIGVMDTLVNLETRQLTYEATLDLMRRHPDLAGIYVAGGGMEGAIAALREVRPPEKVALIVNELTDESRAALSERYALMVIATPLGELCEALIERMVAASADPAMPPGSPAFFEPRLYLPESV